jgi:uncharacterized circularly permuted ATP-grasp superfamily protein/uncharacterized alpha-E superfamily protein
LPARRPIEPDDTARARRIDGWISGYGTAPGVPDEMIGADGAPRPHWLTFLETLAGMGDADIEQRFAAAERRISDMGVSYRVHGEARERAWRLSQLPLLLTEAEWSEIATGIEQRAELLDLVLRDIYGAGRLVAEGALPAATIAGSPDFIRPMRGVTPPGGRWLRFYAADIGRGPDGKWWVLGDRAQAPSGSGYALQNRLVLSGTFPTLYQDMKAQRLAPFFRDFRAGLASAAQRSEPRICLLTPGPYSESYAEQVNLARYLGLLLVEGDDLVTSDGKLYVRTIAGLKRADVLWRRVDADWCDPLELNARSRLGVPGLLDAIRQGSVAVANMPGAGLIESRALMSFLPSLSKRLLGEKLRLSNVATWWCGQDDERDEVLAELDERSISGAFVDRMPGFPGREALVGGELNAAQRADLIAAIRDRGMDYVGQEVVRLSTTPAWYNGALTPRPFALRVFAAATADGWKVMPGGFCRISDRLDVRAVSMDAGAQSADVWVLGDRAAEPTTLLPSADGGHIVRVLGSLPSRAADNLFWMSRYLERAEATLRIVRCLCNRLTEARAPDAGDREPIKQLEKLLVAWGAVSPETVKEQPSVIALSAAADLEEYGSVLSIARDTKRAASIIRERLSQEVWQLLSRLETRLEALGKNAKSEPEILEHAERALHTLAALSGLINENFNRVAGWSFIDLGKRIERAINTCRFARQFADGDATMESLDSLMELIDSQITYRSRYLAGAALAPLLDMAILDPFNPRSVGFQVARIDDHLAALPSLLDDGVLEPQRRLSVRLRADLEAEDAHKLDAEGIFAIERRLMNLADAIGDRYFSQGARLERVDRASGLA